MWFEQKQGTGININRSREILNSGAKLAATACPFCLTMIGDGIKTLEGTDSVVVRDIAEVVFDRFFAGKSQNMEKV